MIRAALRLVTMVLMVSVLLHLVIIPALVATVR